MKNWYKSKTLWASLVTVIGGLGAYFTGEKTLESLIIVVIGAVFAYLRTITDSPIG